MKKKLKIIQKKIASSGNSHKIQKDQQQSPDIQTLRSRLVELAYLGSMGAILDWDEQVNMPQKGAGARAELAGYLSGLSHDKFLTLNNDGLLDRLRALLVKGKLATPDAVTVRETLRDFDREKKFTTEFVKELSATISEAQSVWRRARKESNFKVFAPHLARIVELKRKEAKITGYKESPYDALLDIFEPGATSAEVMPVLEELKDFLVPFLAKIKGSGIKINRDVLKGNFPIPQQEKFNRFVSEKMGLDYNAARIDVAAHPFATTFHTTDVRITTRYSQTDIFDSLSSVIHESGHALYEQGLPSEHFGTPLGQAISLGIHESQSRLWENIVGRSMPFWEFFYPHLQKEFPKPFKKLPLQRFFAAINIVEPSLTRVEADEVTYSLHVIIRFEIEKALIEGSIEVNDLPKIWNAKYKEYLGIKVPSDAQGVLQDVHWSAGLFGYFPTYALGNLYSAQFYAQAKKEILNLEKEISLGHLEHLREWLRKKIHVYGKLYSAAELVRKVTGQPLNSKYFTDYLEQKYGQLYRLK